MIRRSLFLHASPRGSFEISVGENAMEFTPDEVVDLIHRLLNRAGRAMVGA